MAAETLWRCTKCGKWSHAKRRPVGHERWVRITDPLYAAAKAGRLGTVINFDERYDEDGIYGGAMVACGPFARYSAVLVDEEIS